MLAVDSFENSKILNQNQIRIKEILLFLLKFSN